MTKKTFLLNRLIEDLGESEIISKSRTKTTKDKYRTIESKFSLIKYYDDYILVELVACNYDGDDTCHHSKLLLFNGKSGNKLDYSRPLKTWIPDNKERFYISFIDATDEKMLDFIKNQETWKQM